MSTSPAVVWTPRYLGYRLSETHPLDPIRLDLTMRLATGLGVLEGIDILTPEPAPDEEIERIHRSSYLAAVKTAPEAPFDVGHGLGTLDNPIFFGMHEASALVCGGSLLAAKQIADGRVDRAVNIAGGLHHAMAA
jgi:acetoin utilization protein AcuC